MSAVFITIRLYLVCTVLLVSTGVAAHSEASYDALADPAIFVKNPGQTPLVAITRNGSKVFAVGTHGVIVSSTDNGRTWLQAPVPVDLTLTSIFFSSPKDGWVVGHYGVVLHSDDGGTTWNKELDGENVIKALTVTSNQAQLADPSAADSKLKLRIMTAFQSAGPSKPFLMIGPCGNGLLAAGQQDMAMFTNNQGRSWREWTSQIANPNFQNIYASLTSGDTTILIGEAGLVLKSNSGCTDFKPLLGPFTATLYGGISIEPKTMVLYGLDGGLFRTGDGGTTWQTIAMPPDAVIDAGVTLTSGRVLIGTLSGTMYLSDDAGVTFHQIGITEPFQIAGMVVAPNGDVITVGNGGIGIVPSQLIR